MENVAGGQTGSFQNVRGGEVYTMYQLFKSLGGVQELTYVRRGANPPPPLK